MLKKKVAMRTMKWHVVDLERNVNCPEMEKGLLMKTSEKLCFYTLQTGTSSGRITNKMVKHIPLVYITLASSVEKEIKRGCVRKVFELISHISELKRNRKRRGKAAE